MRKIIKKYGDANVITFTPEEMKAYNLKIGKIVDIDINEIEDKKILKKIKTKK